MRAPLALVFAALASPCAAAGEIVVANVHLEIRLDDQSGAIRQVRNVERGLEFRTAAVVHLAPAFGEIDIVAWKQVVRPARLAISVQGWVRQVGPEVTPIALASLAGDEVARWARGCRVLPRPWDIDVEALRGVDIAFLSDEDLVGQGDLLDRLRRAVPLVVLTHGVRGCSLFSRSRVTRVGVFATREVDATGAGDIFAAAMLWALATGAGERAAARFGAAAASLAVEAMGSEALAHLEQAAARAAQVPILSEETLPLH